VLAVIGGVACESFGGSDDDADVTTSPPTNDAAADGDPSNVDGGGPPPDGGGAGEAAVACGEAGAIFCEGFDGVTAGTAPAIPGWKPFLQTGNSYSVVAEGRITPNALMVEGAGYGFSILEATAADVGPADLTLTAFFKIEDESAPIVNAQVSWYREQNTQRRAVAVSLTPYNSLVAEYDGMVGAEQGGPLKTLQFTQWTLGWHELEIAITATASQITVHVDKSLLGTIVLERPHVGGGKLTLEIGANGFDQRVSKRVLWDDVLVRVP
jgi:hypothetical protein